MIKDQAANKKPGCYVISPAENLDGYYRISWLNQAQFFTFYHRMRPAFYAKLIINFSNMSL